MVIVIEDECDGQKSNFFSIDQILRKDDHAVCDDVFEQMETMSTSTVCSGESADIISKGRLYSSDDEKMASVNKDEKHILPSYTTIIAQSILSSSEQKLPLGAVYEYIAENFPGILKKGQGWRNCVRHNLSLSECFIKAGKARNGRGNYWGIHPRYIKNFSNGDFRKRPSVVRPRNRSYRTQYPNNNYIRYSMTQDYEMKRNNKSSFTIDSILSTKERKQPVAVQPSPNIIIPSPTIISYSPPAQYQQNVMRFPPRLYPYVPKPCFTGHPMPTHQRLYSSNNICSCRSCVGY